MRFARGRNPGLDGRWHDLARYYRSHGENWRVRWDYAFFQMLVETNYLTFRKPGGAPGDVHPRQNNFAGLGATGGVPGDSFPNASTGVLAQIQHLVAYSGERLDSPTAPRTRLKMDEILAKSRALGRPVTFQDLAGRWAVDRAYGRTIESTAQAFRAVYCRGQPLVAVGGRPGPARMDDTWPSADRWVQPWVDRWSDGEDTAEAAPPVARATVRARGPRTAEKSAKRPRALLTRAADKQVASAAAGKADEAPPVRVIDKAAKETAVAAPRQTEAPSARPAAAIASDPASAQPAALPPKPSTAAPAPPTAPAVPAPPTRAASTPAPPAPSASSSGTATEKTQAPSVAGLPSIAPSAAASPAAPAPARPSGPCKIFRASYGGPKTVLIRSQKDGVTHFTLLEVIVGREQEQTKAYMDVHARGGTVLGDYPAEAEALKKSFELCPSG